MRYRLLPHKGAWESVNPDRQSMALHEPLLAEWQSPQAAPGRKASFLRVAPSTVVLTTVKFSRKGGALLAARL